MQLLTSGQRGYKCHSDLTAFYTNLSPFKPAVPLFTQLSSELDIKWPHREGDGRWKVLQKSYSPVIGLLQCFEAVSYGKQRIMNKR